MSGVYPYDDPLALSRVKHKSAYIVPRPSRGGTSPRQDTTHSANPPPLREVCSVVSNLVQALNDARDELLTLLTRDSITRERQSKSPAAAAARFSSRLNCTTTSAGRSTSRPFPAAHGDTRRSMSPNHARRGGGGGTSTMRTFPVDGEARRSSTNSNARTSSNTSSHDKKSHTTTTMAENFAYSPTVAFGLDLDFEKVHRGRSPPADAHPSSRLPGGTSGCPSTRNPRNITVRNRSDFLNLDLDRYGDVCRRRHCTAIRYADLLTAETNHLRERRLAEEYLARRPSWC